MIRNRNLLIFFVGLALTVGVSCTGADMPLGPQGEAAASSPPPADSAPAAPADTGTVVPSDTAKVVPVDTATVVPVDTAAPPIDTTTAPGDGGTQPVDGALLNCRPQPYAKTTAVIGPEGGVIFFGNEVLKIFSGALSENVTITAEQVEGSVNSVRFSPEGLHFAVPAVLSLSYKNCDNVKHAKSIVYTDESLNILEPTLSYDFNNSSHVAGLIYHFSRYAVAY